MAKVEIDNKEFLGSFANFFDRGVILFFRGRYLCILCIFNLNGVHLQDIVFHCGMLGHFMVECPLKRNNVV